VRDASAIEKAVAATAERFGGIDICVNNVSAINLSRSLDTEAKRFDLMHQINLRGTFLVSRACVPFLRRSSNPHVLTLAPPLTMRSDWFADHLAYTIGKYGMSMVMFGMAEEFRGDGIACNALWPRTTIATAAVEFALGGKTLMRRSRKPEIMADAAHAIFLREARRYTGNFVLDEDILREEGRTDFDDYRYDPAEELEMDLFVESGPSTTNRGRR
jgi:citronellol/citronellal dehydrogenase